MPRFQSTRSRSLKQINKYTIQLPVQMDQSANKPVSLKNHSNPLNSHKQNQKQQYSSSKNLLNQYYVSNQRLELAAYNPIHKYRLNNMEQSGDNIKLKKQLAQSKQQLEHKKREINCLKDKLLILKAYESQLIQAYRVINYYEGKVLQLQKIAQEKVLDSAEKSEHKNKNEQILDSYQKKNIELSAKLEQSNYQIRHLEQKIVKEQFKNKQLIKKAKEDQSNKLQINQSKNQQDKIKLKTIYDRLQNIQAQLKLIAQYNEELSMENASLQLSQKMILQQNQQLKRKITELEQKIKSKPQQIKVVKTEKTIPPIPKKPTPQINRVSLPPFSLDKKFYQQSKTTDKYTQSNQLSSIEDKRQQSYISKIPYQTLQRLRFNLMQSSLSHLRFFQQVKENLDNNKFLMAQPYNLSFEESMTIINEIKNNMNDLEDYPKFKEIIPPYYIFPADRKNAYLTITSNIFKTNEDHIQILLQKQQNRQCSVQTLAKWLQNWGMTAQQVQFTHLKSYELTNHVLPINFAKVASFFLTI